MPTDKHNDLVDDFIESQGGGQVQSTDVLSPDLQKMIPIVEQIHEVVIGSRGLFCFVAVCDGETSQAILHPEMSKDNGFQMSAWEGAISGIREWLNSLEKRERPQ